MKKVLLILCFAIGLSFSLFVYADSFCEDKCSKNELVERIIFQKDLIENTHIHGSDRVIALNRYVTRKQNTAELMFLQEKIEEIVPQLSNLKIDQQKKELIIYLYYKLKFENNDFLEDDLYGFLSSSRMVSSSNGISESSFTIEGFVNDENVVSVRVNGFTLTSFQDAEWTYVVSKKFGNLQKGENIYTIDYLGAEGEKIYTDYFTIHY